MNRRRWLTVVLLAGLLCAPSLGDDTTAAIGVGGLIFTHNTDIRMAREDLYISPQQVRIHFEFYNDSANDVTAIVAFPLPDLDPSNYEVPVNFPTHDPLNFVNFHTSVNGKPVEVHPDQRALVGKRDITAGLQAIGVPVSGDPLMAQFDHWTPAQITALKKLRATAFGGPDNDYYPIWRVQTCFWWQQRFPAHQTTVIDHTYQPITGGAYEGADPDIFPDLLTYPQVQGRCLGVFAGSSVQHLVNTRRQDAGLTPGQDAARTENPPLVWITDVDYILTTGGNWKGPIGIFHLTLDKMAPENVLATCWPTGLKATTPTTYEVTLRNFTPTRNLKIVVLH
ncbi:MAG: DUF4424 family protein [Terriglobales bacterium]